MIQLEAEKAVEVKPVMLINERITGGPEMQCILNRGGWIEAHQGFTIMDRFALEAMKVFLERAMTTSDDHKNVSLPPIENVVNFCAGVGLAYVARRQAIIETQLSGNRPTPLAPPPADDSAQEPPAPAG